MQIKGSMTTAEVYLSLIHNYCTATWEEEAGRHSVGKISAGSFQVGGLRIAINQDYIQVYKSTLLLQSTHCSVGVYTLLENIKRVIYFAIKE